MGFSDLIASIDRVAQTHLGGETITYRPELGAPVDVIGIFDTQHALASGGVESGVEVTRPTAFFRIDDLPTDPEDDDPVLTIRGDDYRVTERRLDGEGGIVLVLRKAS